MNTLRAEIDAGDFAPNPLREAAADQARVDGA